MSRPAQIRRVYRRALRQARTLPLPPAKGAVAGSDGLQRSRIRSVAIHMTREVLRGPRDRVLLDQIAGVSGISRSGASRAWSRWWNLRDDCPELEHTLSCAVEALARDVCTVSS
jgi:hypothetical protein